MNATALILGGAACLDADVQAFKTLVGEAYLWSCHVIGVSRGGVGWSGRLDHWATLHPEDLPGYIAEREALGYGRGFVTWSRRNPELVDMVIPHWGAGGSGRFGCTVAAYLGIKRAVLCGCPTDPSPHLDGREVWDDWKIHREGWITGAERTAGWVRSMSGWTAEFLGKPDTAWLEH